MILLLAFTLGGGVLLIGCGGGGDEEPDPKQEFLAQGDRICALGTLDIGNEAQDRYGTPQVPAKKQTEFTRKVIVPVLSTEVLTRLRALTPPEGDEQEVEEIYAALEMAIDTLDADPSLYSEPNVGGAFDQVNTLAQGYGFRQCGSS